MASESQYASLDGAVNHDEAEAVWWKSSVTARRSASIFSRKGSSVPKPPFIAQVAVPPVPKPMSERQKRWSRRKSAPPDSSPKIKGTVLNIVPPAKTITMTALEEEMATSPNEEILSAITGSPTSPSSLEWPTPTKEQMDSLWNQTHAPLIQRTQSVYQKARDSRVGVWKNGVAHWDDAVRQDGPWWAASNPSTVSGFTPLRRMPTEKAHFARNSKPRLSVIIPTYSPLLSDTAFAGFIEAHPASPALIVAAPNTTLPAAATPDLPPRNSISTALESSIRQSQQLILSPAENIRPPLSRFQKSKTTTIAEHSPQTPRASHHSSCSSKASIEDDSDSDYSRKSSITSLGTPAAETTSRKLERNAQPIEAANVQSEMVSIPNINKPLPPPPSSPPLRAAPRPSHSTEATDKVRRSSIKSVPDSKRTCTTHRKRSSRSLQELDLLDEEFMQKAPNLRYGSFPSTPALPAVPSSPTLSEAEHELETHLSNLSTPSLVSRADSIRDVQDIQFEQFSLPPESDITPTENDTAPTESETTPTGAAAVRPKPRYVVRNGSVHSVMHPPERAPTLPKRSRKREWNISQNLNLNRAAQLSLRTARRRKSESQLIVANTEHDPMPVLKRAPSAAELSVLSDVALLHKTPMEEIRPPVPRIIVDEGLVVLNGPVKVYKTTRVDTAVPCTAAEDVLLHILAALTSTTDLFNTAVINKGMYRVFKENEMELIQTVTYNQSPAAWEFLEWCTPNENDDAAQWTPNAYLDAYRENLAVIDSLKELILERCQTVIRRETAFALCTPTHPHAQRFTDAFWRIWCFCTIFGNGKGREEDVTGQLDWLKGGILATNQDLTATMNMNLDYDMISVLLNPPEYFAKGNENGLNSQQLYDMIEIWTCMKTLLEGYHYRTEQAWVYGIFANTGLGIGDAETEAEILEEWTSHLLSLGPKVVLTMAEHAQDKSGHGFSVAQTNGWTNWRGSATENNSSNNSWQDFFKPIARLYEERVAANALKWQNPLEREKKELSRKRVANLAMEIKLARQASGFRRRPVIDMSLERSMSGVSRKASTASTSLQGRHSIGPVSPLSPPPNVSTFPSLTSPTNRHSSPPPRTLTPPESSSLWSPRNISPIIEDRVETFNRLSLLNYGLGVAEDTVERAVGKIVDMGFSAEQARRALRATDDGGGLRVDWAVEMLLKEGICRG